jgi:hypothetical protein
LIARCVLRWPLEFDLANGCFDGGLSLDFRSELGLGCCLLSFSAEPSLFIPALGLFPLLSSFLRLSRGLDPRLLLELSGFFVPDELTENANGRNLTTCSDPRRKEATSVSTHWSECETRLNAMTNASSCPRTTTPRSTSSEPCGCSPARSTQVELAFDPKSLRFIGQRRYHHSQSWSKMDDGRLRMTLEVPAGENDFEIVNFVLGFGPYVEVLSPVELRERVKGEIGKMRGGGGTSRGTSARSRYVPNRTTD